MGDESCNRPLLNTFYFSDKWEGTAIRLTPKPGDLSAYTNQSLLRGKGGVIFVYKIYNLPIGQLNTVSSIKYIVSSQVKAES